MSVGVAVRGLVAMLALAAAGVVGRLSGAPEIVWVPAFVLAAACAVLLCSWLVVSFVFWDWH